MNRRTFFQTTLTALSAMTLFSLSSQSEERRRGGGVVASSTTLVDPNDSAAKAVFYTHNNNTIKDTKLQTERTGVKFPDQKCKNCAFYQFDKEVLSGGKKVAPCLMPFAVGKVVSADGWCASWAKKVTK